MAKKMELVMPEPFELDGQVVACPTCPYSVTLLVNGDEMIQCRFFPPTSMLLPQQTNEIGRDRVMRAGMAPALQSVFPRMDPTSWCGQHPLFEDAVMQNMEAAEKQAADDVPPEPSEETADAAE